MVTYTVRYWGEMPVEPDLFQARLSEVTTEVAKHYFGQLGVAAYQMFGSINSALFEDKLPLPLIVWLHAREVTDPARDLITLHPDLVNGDDDNPWGVPKDHLGYGFAAESLIHRCIHLAVHKLYIDDDRRAGTLYESHAWITEVNRLAPLLGFQNVTLGPRKPKRVNEDGESVVRRVQEGDVPYDPCVTDFPRGLRYYLDRGAAGEYYQRHRDTIPTL